jgi:hypothetical protein
MRRDFAAFRVFRGSFRKLQTRKVTRKDRDFRERKFAQTRDQKCEMFRISA